VLGRYENKYSCTTSLPWMISVYDSTFWLIALIALYIDCFYLLFITDEAQKKLEEYATKDSKSSNSNTKKTSTETSNSHSKSNVGKSSKRSNLKKRTDKTNYSHNWLLTTLKGHTGSVMDMSFSANGKYLATCADGEFSFCFI
jgi:WD40 repeat protein